MQVTRKSGSTWKQISLAALFAAGIATAPASQADVTLMLNGWAGPTQQLTKDILVGWAKEVEKASNGRIKYSQIGRAHV